MRPTPLSATDAISDADLVARAVNGDRWGRDVLYRRYVRYVLGIAVRLLGNHDDAEEVVQDAFVRAFTRLASLREPAAFRAWLVRVVVSLGQRRLRRMRLLRFVGLDRSVDDHATLAELAAPDLQPDDRAELALIDRLLVRVRPSLRVTWMLRRVDGLPLAEVASACACSLATAKRRIAIVDCAVRKHVAINEVSP